MKDQSGLKPPGERHGDAPQEGLWEPERRELQALSGVSVRQEVQGCWQKWS